MKRRIQSVSEIPSVRSYTASLEKSNQFGNWRYDESLKVLTHRNFPGYEIDVERMTTSAETLDLIFQSTAKNWVSRQDAGDLLEAIRTIVNPQANLCSWGRECGPGRTA